MITQYYKVVALCLLLLSTLLFTGIANSGICHGKMLDPINDICWHCLFPITIGNTPLSGSDLPDTTNPHKLLCRCKDTPLFGVAMGYWEPMGIVEVTHTPFCTVSFGGQPIFKSTAQGSVDTQNADQNGAFYHVHFYNFPLLENSGILGGSCKIDNEFFMPTYFSELDPTWQDEKLAAIIFPETLLFTNPVSSIAAEASCAIDSAAANTILPIDSLFWCAGSQGFMFPMSGRVVEQVSPIQATTLVAERVLFKLHQLLLIPDTEPSDLCSPSLSYHLPKSRYRYQMSYPSQGPCRPFGRTTLTWGGGKMHLMNGDDAAFVIWRKRNCCNY